MRKTLFLFVLLALVAPLAFAADAPPAVDETAVEVPDADAFFAELSDTPEAESKYVCPIDAPGDCTRAFDCELLYGTCNVGNGWQCLGGNGSPCTGTCYCC